MSPTLLLLALGAIVIALTAEAIRALQPPPLTPIRYQAPHPRAGQFATAHRIYPDGSAAVRLAPGHVEIVPAGEWRAVRVGKQPNPEKTP